MLIFYLYLLNVYVDYFLQTNDHKSYVFVTDCGCMYKEFLANGQEWVSRQYVRIIVAIKNFQLEKLFDTTTTKKKSLYYVSCINFYYGNFVAHTKKNNNITFQFSDDNQARRVLYVQHNIEISSRLLGVNWSFSVEGARLMALSLSLSLSYSSYLLSDESCVYASYNNCCCRKFL